MNRACFKSHSYMCKVVERKTVASGWVGCWGLSGIVKRRFLETESWLGTRGLVHVATLACPAVIHNMLAIDRNRVWRRMGYALFFFSVLEKAIHSEVSQVRNCTCVPAASMPCLLDTPPASKKGLCRTLLVHALESL